MNKESHIIQAVEVSAKALLSTIPIGGPLISAVWDSVKDNAIQKRLDDWRQKIEERLSTIESSLESVGKNESFATAIISATEIAIRVGEDKKREYLANAVVNSLETDLNENVQIIFMAFIAKYSIWHIQILDYFRNPRAKGADASSYMAGSPKTPLFVVYPEFESNSAIVDKIVTDLYTDGLLNTQNLNVSMTPSGMVDSRTTALGNQFLDYIIDAESIVYKE